MLTKVILLILENLFLPYRNSMTGDYAFYLIYGYIVMPVLLLFTVFWLVRLLQFRDAQRRPLMWGYEGCLVILLGIFLLSNLWWEELLFFGWWGCLAVVLALYSLAPAARLTNWREAFGKRIPVLILGGVDLIWMIISACICKIGYSGDYFSYVQTEIAKPISHHDIHVFVLLINLVVVAITVASVNKYNEERAYDGKNEKS